MQGKRLAKLEAGLAGREKVLAWLHVNQQRGGFLDLAIRCIETNGASVQLPDMEDVESRFIYVCWRTCNLRVLELQKVPLQKTLLPLCMARFLRAKRIPPDELFALQAFREALKVFVLQWMLLDRVMEIIREERMKTNRGVFWTFALTVGLTTLTLVASAQMQKSRFQVFPTPNQYPINDVLYASSASSPNDIWAVGNTTIHFDGHQWTMYPAPGADDSGEFYLSGVLDFSPTLAWAGGGGDAQGQIIDLWNGQSWQRLQGVPFPPDYNAFVSTMSGTSPNDIWVTGWIDPDQNFQLFFEHWDGQSWGNIGYLPGGVGRLWGASQDAPNDAYAAGLQILDDNYAPLLMHYEGGDTWYQVRLPLPQQAVSGLYGVLALAPTTCGRWDGKIRPVPGRTARTRRWSTTSTEIVGRLFLVRTSPEPS